MDAAQQRRVAQGQGRPRHEPRQAAQRARAPVPLRAAAQGLLLRRRRRPATRRAPRAWRTAPSSPPPASAACATAARSSSRRRWTRSRRRRRWRARGDARRGRRRPPRRLPHGHPRPPAGDALGRGRRVRPRSRTGGARLLLPALPPRRRQARGRVGHPARGHAGAGPAHFAPVPGRPVPHPHPRHLPGGWRRARSLLRHGHGDAGRARSSAGARSASTWPRSIWRSRGTAPASL